MGVARALKNCLGEKYILPFSNNFQFKSLILSNVQTHKYHCKKLFLGFLVVFLSKRCYHYETLIGQNALPFPETYAYVRCAWKSENGTTPSSTTISPTKNILTTATSTTSIHTSMPMTETSTSASRKHFFTLKIAFLKRQISWNF